MTQEVDVTGLPVEQYDPSCDIMRSMQLDPLAWKMVNPEPRTPPAQKQPNSPKQINPTFEPFGDDYLACQPFKPFKPYDTAKEKQKRRNEVSRGLRKRRYGEV
jgi:hypothetical protein